jgi:hypothetical protein
MRMNKYNLINMVNIASDKQGKRSWIITYKNAVHSYDPEGRNEPVKIEFSDFANMMIW